MLSHVIIGIPTFRRPDGLKRILDSINAMETSISFSVLVAENDPENEAGRQLTSQIKEGYRCPLKCIVVQERGISQVRNALIRESISLTQNMENTALAMVDDDQIVDKLWLQRMVAVQFETKADCVGNHTLPKFEATEPGWAKLLPIYYPADRPEGKCAMIEGTGGVLLTMDFLRKIEPFWFDPYFSLTGGGDKEFFTRSKRNGAKLAYARSAISYEVYQSDRLSKKWASRRAYRVGAGDMRNTIVHGKRSQIAVEVAKSFAALAMHPLSWLSADKDNKFVASLRKDRALGKISTMLGRKYNEYAKTHGK